MIVNGWLWGQDEVSENAIVNAHGARNLVEELREYSIVGESAH